MTLLTVRVPQPRSQFHQQAQSAAPSLDDQQACLHQACLHQACLHQACLHQACLHQACLHQA
ncbi:pentapeptide repeat-containing protein [Synechococcus sp. MW101C3]|uniref:pentapeptide repeat-containing protein n=1 Tax=Synechococcus sp. MW101C3 TaxID=210768 RepID=UPI001303E0C9